MSAKHDVPGGGDAAEAMTPVAPVGSKTPPPVHTVSPSDHAERVLGHNHLRRTPEEVLREKARRAARPSRLRRRLRYTLEGRMVTSPALRAAVVWFLALSCASVSMGGLWSLGEGRAGIVLSLACLAVALVAHLSLELAIWCPRLPEAILYHAGVLKEVFIYEPAYGDDGGIDAEMGDDSGLEAPWTPDQGKPQHGDVAASVNRASARLARAGAQVLGIIGRVSGPHGDLGRFGGGSTDDHDSTLWMYEDHLDDYGDAIAGGPYYDSDGDDAEAYDYRQWQLAREAAAANREQPDEAGTDGDTEAEAERARLDPRRDPVAAAQFRADRDRLAAAYTPPAPASPPPAIVTLGSDADEQDPPDDAKPADKID